MPGLTTRDSNLWLLVGMAVAAGVLGRVPVLHWAVYPFQLFNTFVHELSHGLAAIVTGGSFRNFEVYSDGSGVAQSAGGVRWIISSAGYLGSALVGGALILITASGVSPRRVLLGLGIGLAIACVLFVRNFFGIASGLVIAGAIVAAGLRLEARWASWLLLFLAVQTALNALDSLWGLVRLSTFHQSGQPTDAGNMAAATGVPAFVWAIVWSGLAILILWQAVRMAYLSQPAP
jgi:hypothetical protein